MSAPSFSSPARTAPPMPPTAERRWTTRQRVALAADDGMRSRATLRDAPDDRRTADDYALRRQAAPSSRHAAGRQSDVHARLAIDDQRRAMRPDGSAFHAGDHEPIAVDWRAALGSVAIDQFDDRRIQQRRDLRLEPASVPAASREGSMRAARGMQALSGRASTSGLGATWGRVLIATAASDRRRNRGRRAAAANLVRGAPVRAACSAGRVHRRGPARRSRHAVEDARRASMHDDAQLRRNSGAVSSLGRRHRKHAGANHLAEGPGTGQLWPPAADCRLG